MASNKRQAGTILSVIARLSKLKPHEYAPTQYDENNKLIDDCLTQEDEKLYWESFVDRKQALELDRRLSIVEAEDYEEGSQEFQQMEDEDD